MQNKVKIFTLCAAVALMLSACSADESVSQASTASNEANVESSVVSDSESDKPKTEKSSANKPLDLGEWGVCGKYCVKTSKYEDVPVKVTEILRGEDAEKEIKALAEKNISYEYKEAETGKEWVAIKYELWLDEFSVDKAGTDKSITAEITGKNGGTLTLEENKYYTTAITLTDGEYVYDGTAEGLIIFMLPKNLTDYTVVLGEYDETRAYFSGK